MLNVTHDDTPSDISHQRELRRYDDTVGDTDALPDVTRPRCCTIPVCIGSTALCVFLVAASGLLQLAVGIQYHPMIVEEGRLSYHNAVGMEGQAALGTALNQIFAAVRLFQRLYSNATRFPSLSAAVVASDEGWDKMWQQAFVAEHACHKNYERKFAYLDWTTRHWTGEGFTDNERADAHLRYAGSAGSRTLQRYTRNLSSTRELKWTSNGTTTFLFPPELLFQRFIDMGAAYAYVPPTIDPTGGMVYGLAVFVFTKTFPLQARGVLFEWIPIVNSQLVSMTSNKIGHLSGTSILVDGQGGVLVSTHPLLTGDQVFCDMSTPGAVCSSVTYQGQVFSRCRHSRLTVGNVWPELASALGRLGSNLSTPMSETSFTFEHNRETFIASFTAFESGNFGREVWWTAVVTPEQPIYGAYFRNRISVIKLICWICVGIASVTLALTFGLTYPILSVLDELTATLAMRRSRYTSYEKHEQKEACPVLALSEVEDIRAAVECLSYHLDSIAAVLPPSALASIRSQRRELRMSSAVRLQHSSAVEVDPLSGEDGDDHCNADDDTNPLLTPAFSQRTTDHLEAMLTWFEGYYQLREADESYNDVLTITSDDSAPLALPGLLHGGASLTKSILSTRSILFKAPRRRGFFLAILVDKLGDERGKKSLRSHTSDVISRVLQHIRAHGGDVESLESNAIIASFGCYDEPVAPMSSTSMDSLTHVCNHDLPSNSCVKCAIAIQRDFSERCPSARICAAIDSGWFESVEFKCADNIGELVRRRIVSCGAREAAARLVTLASFLREPILVTSDALRHVSPSIFTKSPMMIDNVRFSQSSGLRLYRRGAVLVFCIPVDSLESSSRGEMYRWDEESLKVADAFRLMIVGNYIDAERKLQFLRDHGPASPHCVRLALLCRTFAEFVRQSDSKDLAPYSRSECCPFEERSDHVIVSGDCGDDDELIDSAHIGDSENTFVGVTFH